MDVLTLPIGIAGLTFQVDAAARIWFGEFARPNFPDLPTVELPAHILAKLQTASTPEVTS